MIPFDTAEIETLRDLLDDAAYAEAVNGGDRDPSLPSLRVKVDRWLVLQQQRDAVNRRPV